MANNWQELEEQTATALRRLGWEVEMTRTSGDWGADVVAWLGHDRQKPTQKLVVQCKNWMEPAGYEAIKDAHAARTYYRASHAAVVSSSGFTRQCRAAAQELDIQLLRPSELSTGCSLDRSAEGERIREERRRQVQEERHAQEQRETYELWKRWVAYDKAIEEYKLQYKQRRLRHKFRYWVIGACALALVAINHWLSRRTTDSGDLLLAAVGAGAGWLFVAGSMPTEPSQPGQPRP